MEIPFVGGCYLDDSVNLDSQICQNLYPVVDQQGGKSILALYGIPGLKRWRSFPGSRFHLGGSLGFSGDLQVYMPELWFIMTGSVNTNLSAVDISPFSYSFCPTTPVFNVASPFTPIIDPNNRWYYIGTTGGIARFSLPYGIYNSTLSVSGTPGDSIYALTVDRYNRNLYAFTYPSTTVFKIDLASWTVVDSNDLSSNITQAMTCIMDDVNSDYIYVGDVFKIHRVSVSDLSYVDWVAAPAYNKYAVIDPAGDYAYFLSGSPFYTAAYRLQLSTFTLDGTYLLLDPGAVAVGALCIDVPHGYVYAASQANPNFTNIWMFQISTGTWSITNSVIIWANGDYAQCLVPDVDRQKIYVGLSSGNTGASVIRFDIATFQADGTLDWSEEASCGVIKYQNTV